MSNLTNIIENVQAKFSDYNSQLEELRKEAVEDVDTLEEKFTQFSDWLESKKDEIDSIIEDAKQNETDLQLVGDEVNGILDDIEETMNDWNSEYKDDLNNE